MGIKKYIIASIILLLIISGYIFSIESGDYRLQIIDQNIVLPIALWVIIPTIILFIITLTHMFYYGLKSFLSNRSIQKDNENLILLIEKRLLKEDAKFNFKNSHTKEIANILSQLDLRVEDIYFSTNNNKIDKTVQNILNIKAKKYISSKDIKLPNNNSLMIQNFKNRIDMQSDFAYDILKQPSSYDQSVIKYAFIKIVNDKSMTSIKKILDNITIDIDMLKILVKKDSKENSEFSLENIKLIDIIKSLDISNKDLIHIAKDYKSHMSPEKLIKLFEDLSTHNEKLMESYLYVLSEFEMIDNIREILVNSQKDEFTIYKAYLDLRDVGKHYSLDKFYNIS